MQSRMKIPYSSGKILFMDTERFSSAISRSGSWDLGAIQLSARTAAIEASAAGVHWTFAPMVDIARDPRWGG